MSPQTAAHPYAALAVEGLNVIFFFSGFIALAVFIGNDFLPHLPDLHIQEHGLEKLFDVYMKVLPSLGKSLAANGLPMFLAHEL